MVSRMGVICTCELWIGGGSMEQVNNILLWPFGHECFVFPVRNMITWFLNKHNIGGVTVNVYLKDKMNCWGYCEQNAENGELAYEIRICTRQSLRDFTATLMHELVHVQQWEENEWEGDGELEAENRQYKLADEYWDSMKTQKRK